MKRSQRKCWRSLILAVSMVLALMAGSVSGVYAGSNDRGNPNPGVFPTKGKAYGMTYGEWSAAYWQWVTSLSFFKEPSCQLEDTPIHPFLDEGGDCSHGAYGQFGPVWFLAGEGPSFSVVRNCTVPLGKAILIPISSFIAADISGGETEQDLRDAVAFQMNSITDVQAEIDGVPVQNLQDYHFPSPVFTIGPHPTCNYFGVPIGSTNNAVADGYYVMVTPLSKGPHTIYFAWTVDGGVARNYDITYNLNVAHE